MEFLPNIVILTFCGKVQFCFKASLISAAVRPVCSGGQPGPPVSSLSPDGHFVRALSRCFSGSNQSLSHCPIMRWPETAGEMCVVLTRTAQLFWLCYIMLTLLSEDVGAQAEQFLFFFFGHSSFTMLLFFFSVFNISNKVYLNKTTVPPTMLTQTKCYFVQLSYEQRVRRGGKKRDKYGAADGWNMPTIWWLFLQQSSVLYQSSLSQDSGFQPQHLNHYNKNMETSSL